VPTPIVLHCVLCACFTRHAIEDTGQFRIFVIVTASGSRFAKPL